MKQSKANRSARFVLARVPSAAFCCAAVACGLLLALAAAVVGGFGSLPGAILGGIMVGIFENLGAAYISASHKDIYAFLLLILVLMFRPSGLFGVEAKVKA